MTAEIQCKRPSHTINQTEATENTNDKGEAEPGEQETVVMTSQLYLLPGESMASWGDILD